MTTWREPPSCGAPAVSVVMAAYNAGRFLRQALDSLLAQTYSAFELIVVDDGSRDETPRILAGESDPRIGVLTFDVNRGLVSALNAGIERARGSLIARMDADDLCEPERLAEQVRFMEANPAVVACGTGFHNIDDAGRIFGGVAHPSSDEELQRLILGHNPICHPTVMMRSRIVREVGGYRDLGGRHAQDYDLFLRLSERGELANLPARLLRYRYHDEQITHSKLMSQVRAAEIYKGLARQRRAGLEEDLEVVLASAALRPSEIDRKTAAAFGSLSTLYLTAGKSGAAFALLLRALATCPSDPGPILGWMRHFWMRCPVGMRRALTWYASRARRLIGGG